jgi:hypothetical protein
LLLQQQQRRGRFLVLAPSRTARPHAPRELRLCDQGMPDTVRIWTVTATV